MEIIKVGKKEFESEVVKPLHVFHSVSFNELNSDKCNKLHYLLFKESKFKLAIVIGITDNVAFSPFSAPFGGFVPIANNTKLTTIDSAIIALVDWLKNEGCERLEIVLPPEIYNSGFIAKQVNCLYRNGFDNTTIDLNYSFNTSKFSETYLDELPRNARKNLRLGLKSDLQFVKCKGEDEYQLAYNVIAKNREERGFPLRMMWNQVHKTIEVVRSDFFLLKHSNGYPIASAIVFYVTPKIVQVIYWGDLGEYSNLKTMNVLSYRVFEYYKNTNIQIVDVGPSSEDSIPNHGLAEFKEGIGCSVSTKFKFAINL